MGAREQKIKIPVIFDTDILIFHFRGVTVATDFIKSVPYSSRRIPIVVLMELLQGARNNRESTLIEKFIRTNFLEILPLTEINGMKSYQLLKKYSLSHGLRLVDALVAAMALVHKFPLATANLKHYQFIRGLQLLPFSLR